MSVMKIANVIEGLQIAAKYTAPEGETFLAADNGMIYCGSVTDTSEEDSARMRELGWDVGYNRWITFV